MFETASRKKLRFQTNRGELSTEELWDLSVTSLDTVAKAVNRELKASEEESFIPTARTSRANSVLQLKLEILKHVITVKVEEAAKAKDRSERQAKAARLKDLIAQKADENLAAKSLDELSQMVQELETVE